MNKDYIDFVALGDIHAGSKAAVCVPDMELCGGGSFRYSAAQRGLYDAWCRLAQEWANPDVLLVNGDAIEGQARKESGVPCWSTDLDDQLHCAELLVKMFGAKKTYVINGTGYHVDAGGKSLECHLGDRLGAEKIGIAGARSAEEIFLNVGGLTFHAAHHISIGTGWYKTTPLARELVFALLNESDFHKTDVVLRCLSDDTEILTRRGWKNYLQILDSDEVVTLNRESEVLEWKRINAFTWNRDYSEMVRFEGKGVDILVTPDHSMVYRPTSLGPVRTRPAKDFLKLNTWLLPVSGKLPRIGVRVPDSEIKLLAWVIAEGSMAAGNKSKGYLKKNQVRLFQRRSKAHLIRAILEEVGFEFTEHERKDCGKKLLDSGVEYQTNENTVAFYLKQPYSSKIIELLNGEKNIPDWLMEMDGRQFDLFFREYVEGDGHCETGHPEKNGKIFTANRDLADRLNILFCTHGFKSQVSEREKWGKKNWAVTYVRKQEVHMVRPCATLVPYSGITWCVNTNNGTLLTRRNGKVAIVGNSHVHYFCGVEFHRQHGYTLPCWQLRTRYMMKKSAFGMTPSIGAIRFRIYPGGELRIDKRLFKVAEAKPKLFKYEVTETD